MIQITVRPEPYYNATAPEVTEEMIDWVLLTLWSTRLENWFKKIETIDIRANQAYVGSGKIHFYIIINGNKMHEFHREFYTGVKLYQQCPQLGHDFYEDNAPYGTTWNDEPIGRWYWMEYFIRQGVDMGEEGIELQKKLDELKRLGKIKEEKRKAKDTDEQEYALYLRLKEKFKNRKS